MDDVKSEKLEKFEDGDPEEDEAGEDPNEYIDANPQMLESSVWLIKVSGCRRHAWTTVYPDLNRFHEVSWTSGTL